MKGLVVGILFVLGVIIPVVEPCFLCLILGSSYKCPEAPSCCESGFYALDECGCCKKCARAELQSCGGPNGVAGKCAQGLQCLKTCLSCKTVGDSGVPCLFPFIYRNTTYYQCTTKDSDTGQPWCATSVDSDGHVVDFAWGDCSEGCPGTSFECDEKYFSIKEGKCIDKSVPGSIPNWFGAPIVHLDEPTDVLFPAPVCKNQNLRRVYENTCRCDTSDTAVAFDDNGIPRGNCTGFDKNFDDNIDEIWCFLENIRDPRDPVSGCYEDTTWSPKDARFWSSLACQHIIEAAPLEEKNKGLVWRKLAEEDLLLASLVKTSSPTRQEPTTTEIKPVVEEASEISTSDLEYESYDYPYLLVEESTHSVEDIFNEYESGEDTWPNTFDDYTLTSGRESRKISSITKPQRNLPITENTNSMEISLFNSQQLSPKETDKRKENLPSALNLALPLLNDEEIFQRITTIFPIVQDGFDSETTTSKPFISKSSLRRKWDEIQAHRKKFIQGELSKIKKIRKSYSTPSFDIEETSIPSNTSPIIIQSSSASITTPATNPRTTSNPRKTIPHTATITSPTTSETTIMLGNEKFSNEIDMEKLKLLSQIASPLVLNERYNNNSSSPAKKYEHKKDKMQNLTLFKEDSIEREELVTTQLLTTITKEEYQTTAAVNKIINEISTDATIDMDATQKNIDSRIYSKTTITNQFNAENAITETTLTKSRKNNMISTTEKNKTNLSKTTHYFSEETKDSKNNENKFPHFLYSTNPTDVYKSIIHISSKTIKDDDKSNDEKMTKTSNIETSRENFQEVIQNSVLHLGLHSLWEKRRQRAMKPERDI